jgi:hypothetical protein
MQDPTRVQVAQPRFMALSSNLAKVNETEDDIIKRIRLIFDENCDIKLPVI